MEIQLIIPDGFEIEKFDWRTGTVKLKEKPKSILDRIKTVADVLADHNITQEEFEDDCIGLEEDEKAYRLLKMLVKSLNEGWTPDWNDHSQDKYSPWFEMGGSSEFRFDDFVYWHSLSHVGSRLCFKTHALAEHAGKHFTDVYKKFMVT